MINDNSNRFSAMNSDIAGRLLRCASNLKIEILQGTRGPLVSFEIGGDLSPETNEDQAELFALLADLLAAFRHKTAERARRGDDEDESRWELCE
jgi:hypothetical protein